MFFKSKKPNTKELRKKLKKQYEFEVAMGRDISWFDITRIDYMSDEDILRLAKKQHLL